MQLRVCTEFLVLLSNNCLLPLHMFSKMQFPEKFRNINFHDLLGDRGNTMY